MSSFDLTSLGESLTKSDATKEAKSEASNGNDLNKHESTLKLGSLNNKESYKLQNEQSQAVQQEYEAEISKEFNRLNSDLAQQAKFTIEYLAKGLEALDINEQKALEETKSEYVKDPENFSKPEKVIPLMFYNINAMNTQLSSSNLKTKVSIKSIFNRNRAQIYQKAIFAFYILAQQAHKSLNFGTAFKYLRIAFLCVGKCQFNNK